MLAGVSNSSGGIESPGQRRLIERRRHLVRVEDEVAPLLDERARQRIVEDLAAAAPAGSARSPPVLPRNADRVGGSSSPWPPRLVVLGEIDRRCSFADDLWSAAVSSSQFPGAAELAYGGGGPGRSEGRAKSALALASPNRSWSLIGQRQRAGEIGARVLGRGQSSERQPG